MSETAVKEPVTVEVRPGDWVLLDSDDTVLFSHSDFSKVYDEAERMGNRELTISKEPAARYCFY